MSGVLVDQAENSVQPVVSVGDKGRLGPSSHAPPPSIRAATSCVEVLGIPSSSIRDPLARVSELLLVGEGSGKTGRA